MITSSSVVIGLVVRAARGRFGRLDVKAGVEARSREYVQFREPLRWRAGGSVWR